MFRSHFKIPILFLLFLFSFGLFYLHLSYYRENPNFDRPIMDEVYHLSWAKAIRSGEFFPQEAFFRAPLYPYMLALFLTITKDDLFKARLLQGCLLSLSIVLLYLLALQLFPLKYAALAAFLAAIDWYLVYYAGELLIPVVLVFLDLLCVGILFSAIKAEHRGLFFLSGLAAGFSAIARPNILLPIGVILLWLVWKRHFQKALIVGMGLILPILPVTIINYSVSHDPVLIASQGGVNFYIGNNPHSDGVSAVVPGQRATWWGGYDDAIAYAKASCGRNLKSSEISNFYYKKAFSWMKNHPYDALHHFLFKFYLFWHGFDIGNNKDLYFQRLYFDIPYSPYLPYWLLSPFAFVGLLLTFKERNIYWRLLSLFFIAYLLSFVLFFICARYRVPMVPFMILFAIYGLNTFWRQTWKGKIMYLSTIAITLLIFNLPLFSRESHFAQTAYNAALEYRNKDKIEKAMKFFAVAERYGYPKADIENERGNLYFKAGRYLQAENHYRRALNLNPHHHYADYNLAQTLLFLGKLDQSRALIAKWFSGGMPLSEKKRRLAVDVALKMGDYDMLKKYLQGPDLSEVEMKKIENHADTLLSKMFNQEAIQIYRALYHKGYKNDKLLNNWAVAEYRIGDIQKAKELLREAKAKTARENLKRLEALQ